MSAPFVYEGNLVLYYTPTVADMTAPTVAEITTDGTRLVELPSDGVQFGGSQNNASTPMLDSHKISQSPGTEDRSLQINFRLLDASDAMYDLWERGLAGYIVAVPHDGDNVTAGDDARVYKGKAHAPMPVDPSQDSHQMMQVSWPVEDWKEKAIVAA